MFSNLDISGTTTLSTGDVTINTNDGALNLAGITGASLNLGIITGSGTGTFTALADGLGTVTLQSNVSGATGALNFNAGLTANSLTTFSRNYAVKIDGAGTVTADTTFNNRNGVTLGGGQTFTGGLSSTVSTNTLTGNVNTTNSLLTLGATNVTANSTLAAGNKTISLGATTISDNVTLTVGSGGTGSVEVASLVGENAGVANASNATFNVSGTVELGGTVGTDFGTLTVTNSGGTTFQGALGTNSDRINSIVLTDTSGTVEFNGNLFAESLSTGSNNFAIAFDGATSTFTNLVSLTNTGNVRFGDDNGDPLTFTAAVTHTTGSSS